jgi:hypothetical protein
MGLGRVKTRACCGAVECDSHAPDILASSREALVALPVGIRRDLRKCGGSCTSRPRPPFVFMVPSVVSVGDKMTVLELDSNDF